MKIEITRHATHAVVTFEGAIDGKTAPEAQAAIAPVLGEFARCWCSTSPAWATCPARRPAVLVLDPAHVERGPPGPAAAPAAHHEEGQGRPGRAQ
jgi:hypothetical protein